MFTIRTMMQMQIIAAVITYEGVFINTLVFLLLDGIDQSHYISKVDFILFM